MVITATKSEDLYLQLSNLDNMNCWLSRIKHSKNMLLFFCNKYNELAPYHVSKLIGLS